jgi:predicted transcriptional regulator
MVEETLHRPGQMADAMDRPRAWLMAHAIKQFVEREDWFVNHSKKEVKAADAGAV